MGRSMTRLKEPLKGGVWGAGVFQGLRAKDQIRGEGLGLLPSYLLGLKSQGSGEVWQFSRFQLGLYQPAETLTHRRHCPCRARRQYPIGSVYVFAMDVPVGRRQDESGSASFGISLCFSLRRDFGPGAMPGPFYIRPLDAIERPQKLNRLLPSSHFSRWGRHLGRTSAPA
jgi:hypothetical protein